MKVCIGGTFNQLHKGHKSLIKKAFEMAGKNGSVFIGLTSGEIIKRKKGVQPFEKRKKAVQQFLSEEEITEEVTIEPICDRYGPSVEEEFDAIVVSPATTNTAYEINKKRKKIGKKPLKIVQIPFVLAEDNVQISSTRIRKKEIDENGNILKQD
ncbi:MAG: pantetheine-phosphate adenylyltransferase [Thermoplasmatales archaeon]|nr:MAG: pantetheine-phosphate adenylyltransferase [Thermoplasmatales archaeon]